VNLGFGNFLSCRTDTYIQSRGSIILLRWQGQRIRGGGRMIYVAEVVFWLGLLASVSVPVLGTVLIVKHIKDNND